MSRYQTVFFLILCFFSFNTLFSQNSEELFQLYQQQDYRSLKEKYFQAKEKLSKSEQAFYNTLFIQDAELAFTEYKELFQNTTGRVKYLCAQQLKDYYYAKGYYSTASEYERYLAENSNFVESKSVEQNETAQQNTTIKDIEKYYIQVGAFSLQDNAEQMKSMLQIQEIESKIVIRNVLSKELHCVWVTGKDSFNQTLKFAEEIKQKYHLNYKIIKE
jgi:G:T/U-mismatch repair DNA glycosylase